MNRIKGKWETPPTFSLTLVLERPNTLLLMDIISYLTGWADTPEHAESLVEEGLLHGVLELRQCEIRSEWGRTDTFSVGRGLHF